MSVTLGPTAKRITTLKASNILVIILYFVKFGL